MRSIDDYISEVEALSLKGLFDEVDALLGKAIDKFPDEVFLRARFAESAMEQKRWCDAILRWTTLIERLDTPTVDAYIRLARAYFCIQEYDCAEDALEKCSLLQPGYAGVEDIKSEILSERQSLCIVHKKDLAPSPASIHNLPSGELSYGELVKYRFACELNAASNVTHLITLDKGGNIEQFSINESATRSTVEVAVVLNLLKVDCIGFRTYLGADVWVWQLTFERVMQVVEGREGWLFLANDSNKSVDIFKGLMKLDKVGMRAWDCYFDSVEDLRKSYKVVFLVAPAKEQVFSNYYCFKRGSFTLIDQIRSLSGFSTVGGLYPIEKLTFPGSYCKTDTHWTDLGSLIAFKECLESFALPTNWDNLFRFKLVDHMGDLGSKTLPRRLSPCMKLAGSTTSESTKVEFVNYVETSGGVSIHSNLAAPIQKTLLIFGDSFSTSILKFARCLFVRVVRIYSPASPIMSVIENINPDYILLQTNERFMMKSAQFYSGLLESPLGKKLRSLQPEQKNKLREKIESGNRDNMFASFMLANLVT